MTSGIYAITNTKNNKMYIGQSKDIMSRWEQHLKSIEFNKNDSIELYKAMKKYGVSNFAFSILEKCPLEELDEKEVFYINKYRSFIGFEDCNGYNMTLGGQGKKDRIDIEDFNMVLNSKFLLDMVENIGLQASCFYFTIKAHTINNNGNKQCCPTLRELSTSCNCSIRTISRYIKALSDCGYIVVNNGAYSFPKEKQSYQKTNYQ